MTDEQITWIEEMAHLPFNEWLPLSLELSLKYGKHKAVQAVAKRRLELKGIVQEEDDYYPETMAKK